MGANAIQALREILEKLSFLAESAAAVNFFCRVRDLQVVVDDVSQLQVVVDDVREVHGDKSFNRS